MNKRLILLFVFSLFFGVGVAKGFKKEDHFAKNSSFKLNVRNIPRGCWEFFKKQRKDTDLSDLYGHIALIKIYRYPNLRIVDIINSLARGVIADEKSIELVKNLVVDYNSKGNTENANLFVSLLGYMQLISDFRECDSVNNKVEFVLDYIDGYDNLDCKCAPGYFSFLVKASFFQMLEEANNFLNNEKIKNTVFYNLFSNPDIGNSRIAKIFQVNQEPDFKKFVKAVADKDGYNLDDNEKEEDFNALLEGLLEEDEICPNTNTEKTKDKSSKGSEIELAISKVQECKNKLSSRIFFPEIFKKKPEKNSIATKEAKKKEKKSTSKNKSIEKRTQNKSPEDKLKCNFLEKDKFESLLKNIDQRLTRIRDKSKKAVREFEEKLNKKNPYFYGQEGSSVYYEVLPSGQIISDCDEF